MADQVFCRFCGKSIASGSIFCAYCGKSQKEPSPVTVAATESVEIPKLQKSSLPWYEVWMRALTRPGVDTFSELASQGGAMAGRAFLWVFLAGSFDYLVLTFIRVVFPPILNSQTSALGESNPLMQVGRVCAFPLGGAVVLLGFMLVVALIQGIARLLGGTGSYAQLAFVLGALVAPFSLLTALLVPFSRIPYLGLVFTLLAIFITLYLAGLQVPAIKAVHLFSWSKALAAWLLPWLVIGPIAFCILFPQSSFLASFINQILDLVS